MPDTGPPWNIPYVDPTDLVRDWPALSEDVADQVAAGLSAAGALVAVKSAIFTGTQTASVAAGGNLTVTSLSITHALADAGNKLIVSAFLGAAAGSEQRAHVGLAVHDGTSLIEIGAAEGSRTRTTAGGVVAGAGGTNIVTMPSATFVHAPGDTSSRTFTVRAVNINGSTRTLYINRTEADTDNAAFPRAVSSLVIQEVKV